jgi:hypothetical protein
MDAFVSSRGLWSSLDLLYEGHDRYSHVAGRAHAKIFVLMSIRRHRDICDLSIDFHGPNVWIEEVVFRHDTITIR